MKDLKEEVIKFSQRLNSTNLSPLRSGNVSVRTTSDGIEGFLITPSGKKYETLKVEDIVFLELNIDEVGFTAKDILISCPLEIPPRIPPALLDLKVGNFPF